MPRLVCRSVWVAVVCLCLQSGGSDATAEAPHTAFFQANTLYSQGDYDRAIHAYEQLLAAGRHSGHVYFNLGNAYFKNVRSAGRS